MFKNSQLLPSAPLWPQSKFANNAPASLTHQNSPFAHRAKKILTHLLHKLPKSPSSTPENRNRIYRINSHHPKFQPFTPTLKNLAFLRRAPHPPQSDAFCDSSKSAAFSQLTCMMETRNQRRFARLHPPKPRPKRLRSRRPPFSSAHPRPPASENARPLLRCFRVFHGPIFVPFVFFVDSSLDFPLAAPPLKTFRSVLSSSKSARATAKQIHCRLRAGR